MRDPLAAGEQTIGELLGFELGVAVDILEPLRRVARGVLDFQDLDSPFGLVSSQRSDQVGLLL